MELKALFRAEPMLPLASILDTWIAAPITLSVRAQDTLAGPYAKPIAPALPADAKLLRRNTSYSVGRAEVSRHVAFIDLGAIDPQLAARLQGGGTNLGRIFADPRIVKSLVDCGDEIGATDDALIGLASRDRSVDRYLWRRYTAAFEGRAAFLVIELLDLPNMEHVARALGRFRDQKQ